MGIRFQQFFITMLYSFFVTSSKKHIAIVYTGHKRYAIPNGCLDAYEVKVNIDIFKYQEKVNLI